jgi:hypothetical protein
LEPRIVRYFNVITDEEIEAVKLLAGPRVSAIPRKVWLESLVSVIKTLVLKPLTPVTDDIIMNRSFIFTDITVWFRKCATYITIPNHENDAL